MPHKEPAWGFWIPVTDRASAEYAAKMSGLPVFLMGLSFLAIAVLQLIYVQTPVLQIIGVLILLGSIFLIYSGLQIRKLKFMTLPISVGLWLILNILGLVTTGVGVGTVLTLLIGLMAVCGLRGWFWLKRNPTN